jgi:hypothetical protein
MKTKSLLPSPAVVILSEAQREVEGLAPQVRGLAKQDNVVTHQLSQ